MLFVREEIPWKLNTIQAKQFSWKYIHRNKFTIIFREINLRSKKWLLSSSYNPNLTLLNNHIQNISRGLDFYSSRYDSFIVFRDFKAEISETTFSEFCATCNLNNLIKKTSCILKAWKTPLVLINQPKCFRKFKCLLSYPISMN